MKQTKNNDAEIFNLIHKIQEQLVVLDKKVDTLIFRHSAEVKSAPKQATPVNHAGPKPNNPHKERFMHTAICADCKKECKIPFKPSGDRPVYCQDCFSRRKVISLSGMKIDDKSNETTPPQTAVKKEVVTPPAASKTKKKAVAVKKPVAKKKATPKKK